MARAATEAADYGFSFYIVIGFLSGFSERFTKGLLGTAETTLAPLPEPRASGSFRPRRRGSGQAELSTRRHGVVRIAALPSFAAGLLPAVISRFREANPRMSFVVRDAIASRVTASVRSEEVDLGITGGEPADPELDIIHRGEDRMNVVFPSHHPIGRKVKITLEALAEYPLVLMDPDTSVRAIVDAAFIAAGRLPISACEATYMMTAVGMVCAGLGIAVLPASAKEVGAEPSLRSRPIADPAFARPIAVIKKSNRTLPPAAEAFLAEILTVMTT